MVNKKAFKSLYLILTTLPYLTQSQLLGAGTGVASCRAFPYRAEKVDWEVCPVEVSCCNEYGFCRTREAWAAAKFRDCNGISNGIALPDAVLQMENARGGQAGAGLGAETNFDPDNLSGSDPETSPVGSYSTGQEVTASELSADEESGMNYYQAASVNYGSPNSEIQTSFGGSFSTGQDDSRLSMEEETGIRNIQPKLVNSGTLEDFGPSKEPQIRNGILFPINREEGPKVLQLNSNLPFPQGEVAENTRKTQERPQTNIFLKPSKNINIPQSYQDHSTEPVGTNIITGTKEKDYKQGLNGVKDNQNKGSRGNPSRTANTQGKNQSQPKQDNPRRTPNNRNTGLSNANRDNQGSPRKTINRNNQGPNPGRENQNLGNRRTQNNQSGDRDRQGQTNQGSNRRTESKTNDKLNSRPRGTNVKQRPSNTKPKKERIPNPRETTFKNLGNAGSPRNPEYNENSESYRQGQKNHEKNTGTSSRNNNKIGGQFPGRSQQTASQVQGNKRTNQLQEGSTNGKTISASDIFPLDGYENKDGYPAMLDQENCPSYPFCYWNPY